MSSIINPFTFNLTGTSATQGSVIFAGANGVLTEDNSQIFWDDTNKRLGVGTNAPGGTIESMAPLATEIPLIVQGASSQSANLINIINSSNSILTAFDSNGLLSLTNSTLSFTTSPTIINSTGNLNISGGVSLSFLGTRMANKLIYATSQSGNVNSPFRDSTTSINNTSLSGGTIANTLSFSANGTYQSDTNATTYNIIRGFQSQPIFSVTNGGTLTATEVSGFVSFGTIGAGSTITTRRGVRVLDIVPTGGGTIGTNIGLDIADLTGGSTNISIRQQGTSSHNQIQGDTSFGQLAAPSTSKVQIVGDTTTNRTLTLKAVSSQTADILDLTDSSGNNLLQVLSSGSLVINNTGTANTLRFMEPSGSGTNYSEFKAQAQAGNVTYTLPNADGSSGQFLSTDGSGSLSWASSTGAVITSTRKTSDQSKTNSTLADDADITFTVTNGNTYDVQGVLFASSASAIPDIKIAFVHPGGTMVIGYMSENQATTDSGVLTVSGTASPDIRILVTGTNVISIVGSYACTTNGTFKLQWAQNTTNATATKVLIGSYLTIRAM